MALRSLVFAVLALAITTLAVAQTIHDTAPGLRSGLEDGAPGWNPLTGNRPSSGPLGYQVPAPANPPRRRAVARAPDALPELRYDRQYRYPIDTGLGVDPKRLFPRGRIDDHP